MPDGTLNIGTESKDKFIVYLLVSNSLERNPMLEVHEQTSLQAII